MGSIVSSGTNNDELVDILKFLGYIKSKKIELVFRAVDRGDYVLASHRDLAYKDLSWKVGNIHLSAPCVYGKVLEGLSLKPGLSFLNIGSGTGYLSTMAGLILNHNGTNHGIEINEDCLEYAYKKLDEFKRESLALDEFDFCEPVFMHGNCLNLVLNRQYDRVYCGAACPESHESILKQFVKIGGILVMPYKDHLLRIVREDENSWRHRAMLPTSFAGLVIPKSEDRCVLHLPYSEPLSLQELCRFKIRAELRKIIWMEHPELESTHPISRTENTVPNPSSRLFSNGLLSLNAGGILLTPSDDEELNNENAEPAEDSDDEEDETAMARMRFFDVDWNFRQKKLRTVSPKTEQRSSNTTLPVNGAINDNSPCGHEILDASTSHEDAEFIQQSSGDVHSPHPITSNGIKNDNEQSSSARAVESPNRCVLRCEAVNNIEDSYRISPVDSAMEMDDVLRMHAVQNGHQMTESDEYESEESPMRSIMDYDTSSVSSSSKEDSDEDDDDDMDDRLMKLQNTFDQERWGTNENSFGSDSSPGQQCTGCTNKNQESNPRPVQVFAHNVHIKAFSAHMRKKILDLPLPMSLRMYVNRNV